MNLFILSEDIEECVQYYVDKHQKIILEAAQMLCLAYHSQGYRHPYKPSNRHLNHPVSKWVRRSKTNFKWTVDFAYLLNEEFVYRGFKSHKSIDVVKWCENNISLLDFPHNELTPFALAMPEEYKDVCPIKAYRRYYKYDKKHLHKWTNRPKPFFI